MNTINSVIAGDYVRKSVSFAPGWDKLEIAVGLSTRIPLNKNTILRYEVVGQERHNNFSAGKAAVGTALFGSGGAVMGLNSKDTYRVEIYFRNGKKSLLELDSKHYDFLTAELFGVEDYKIEQQYLPKKQK